MLTIPVTMLSAIYMILLSVAYFSKERITNSEITVYSNMIKLTCLGIILDAASALLVVYNMTDTMIFRIVTIFIFMYYIMWSGLFLIYTYIISFKKQHMTDKQFLEKHKKIIKIILWAFIICAMLIPFMPLQYEMQGENIYPTGLSTEITYFVAGFLSMILMLLLMIMNHKNIKSKKYVPVYMLIILFLITVIIQKATPGLILTTSVECFITFLMYFTVENPDVQMIRELYKNKKIIEKSNEDTSRFLFRITADLKNPIKEIINTTNEVKTLKTKEEILEANKYINENANNLDFLLNKALNISDMDTKKIKIYDSKYNVYNLFEEISRHAKEEIGNKLEFKQTMGASIPTYLYGDSIKLKQAISSVIKICQSFTEEGFINIDISSLIKYNMCRLIITIEDSGRGISLDRINEILTIANDDIHISEEEKNLNILEVKKLINILGGSLMIKSDEGKGTTVTIILDQKIVETRETELTKRLENYEQTLQNSKKVLLIDDDEEELEKISKQLEKESIEVTASMIGRDAIEKIRNKNKYDFIILDDELTGITAITILKELRTFKNFNTPVVVMINENKEGIRLAYLKDGFADIVSKSKLDSEIERILKRF